MHRVHGLVVVAGVLAGSFDFWQTASGQDGAETAVQQPATTDDGSLTLDEKIKAVNVPGERVDASEFADAETIFEKYIEAIGGRDEVFGVTSRKFVGRVTFQIGRPDGTVQTQTGRVETYAQAPNLYIQDVIFPGIRTERTVYDGELAWRESDTGGFLPIQGEELDKLRHSAAFYQAAEYEKQFADYEVIGGSDAGGEERLVHVRVEYSSGREDAMLFGEDTGLLHAIVTDRDIGGGSRVAFLRGYRNYESFKGVKYPTEVVEKYANVALEYTLTDVETGIEMPAMNRPAGIE